MPSCPAFRLSATRDRAGVCAVYGKRVASFRVDHQRIERLLRVDLPAEVHAAAITDDCATVAVCGDDKLLRIFENGRERSSAQLPRRVSALRFDASGALFAADAFGWKLLLQQSEAPANDGGGKGSEVSAAGGEDAESGLLALSEDGSLVATVAATKVVVARRSDRSVVSSLSHSAPVTGIVFCCGGNRVVSGSADGTLRLFNSANGTELCCINPLPDKKDAIVVPVDSVAMDDEMVAVLVEGCKTVFNFVVSKDDRLRVLEALDCDNPVLSAVFLNSGALLVSTASGKVEAMCDCAEEPDAALEEAVGNNEPSISREELAEMHKRYSHGRTTKTEDCDAAAEQPEEKRKRS